MRAVLFLPLVALALISTAGAQERQTPLNCQNCWVTAQSKIAECENLSKADMDRLGEMTDAEVASVSDNHDLAAVKACLCALSENAPEILQSCANSCPDEMSKGLQAEANIVDKGVCNIPVAKAQSDENPTDNSTSSEGEDGTESEDNSASTDPKESSSEGGDANDKPSTAGASSVQWSGALLTVVAALASAIAF